MARGSAYSSGGITPVAIQTSVRTMLEAIAGTGKPIKISRFNMTFNGSTAAAGILCELTRITATGTGTALTARAWDGRNTTSAGVAFEYNSTVEPTLGHVLEPFYIPPTQGIWLPQPLGDEPMVEPAAGFGLRATGAASNIPFCTPFMLVEE